VLRFQRIIERSAEIHSGRVIFFQREKGICIGSDRRVLGCGAVVGSYR